MSVTKKANNSSAKKVRISYAHSQLKRKYELLSDMQDIFQLQVRIKMVLYMNHCIRLVLPLFVYVYPSSLQSCN